MRRKALFGSCCVLTSTVALVALVACARQEPPPGTPAQAAPCPEDAGSELPRELACCLIQARTSEEAQICLAKADGGR